MSGLEDFQALAGDIGVAHTAGATPESNILQSVASRYVPANITRNLLK